ncbi:hypothetical protein ACT8ZV_07225 [Nocardioides sp. MAHUQ-72]|uniref:hypothetical protein n=1 Tax=unclassified Nocardioides TaxID=2615069 RepID=UPI00360C1AB6
MAGKTDTAAPIRTAIVRVTIGSFSLAALLGVIALIGGGAFGATEGRILLTTLLVGIVSVAVLCYLATAETPYQPVGVAGGVVVLVPLVTALVMIWSDFSEAPPEWLGKTFGVGAVVAATLAQVSLLLGISHGARSGVRRILVGTLAAAAVLAAMISYLILGTEPSGPYFRVLGVVAILDVLGTVVVTALTKFGRGLRVQAAPVAAPATIVVPPELAARVVAAAERTGRRPEEVVDQALQRYLAEVEVPATSADEG